MISINRYDVFSLVSAFSQKTRFIKQASVCVCVCVCKILSTPNNFQTSYPIDTKFWLHIVSYRNSQTPLISFLNFENCAREELLKLIFSPLNQHGEIFTWGISVSSTNNMLIFFYYFFNWLFIVALTARSYRNCLFFCFGMALY